jgi:hypothetical protein
MAFEGLNLKVEFTLVYKLTSKINSWVLCNQSECSNQIFLLIKLLPTNYQIYSDKFTRLGGFFIAKIQFALIRGKVAPTIRRKLTLLAKASFRAFNASCDL